VLFQAGLDGRQTAVHFRLIQLALGNQFGVALGDLVLAAGSPFFLDVAEGDGVALHLCKSLRDALAHGASADNAYFHSCNLLKNRMDQRGGDQLLVKTALGIGFSLERKQAMPSCWSWVSKQSPN